MAMKGVAGQSGIKIIGPCLNYYDFMNYASFLGGTDNITGSGANGWYIDYVGFNTYPFNQGQLQAGTARQDIINYIQAPFQYAAILDDINAKIAHFTDSKLKVTISHKNCLSSRREICFIHLIYQLHKSRHRWMTQITHTNLFQLYVTGGHL